jgi:hypothetical protein
MFVLNSLVVAFLSYAHNLRIVMNRSPQAIKISTTDGIQALNEGVGYGIWRVLHPSHVSLTQLISHVLSQFRISLYTFYVWCFIHQVLL